MDGLHEESIDLESSDDEVRVTNENNPTSDAPSFTDDHEKRKRGRSTTSDVWSYYEKLGLRDGKEKCKCKGCGKLNVCTSTAGTSHLIRHSSKCRRLDKFHTISEMFSQSSESFKSRQLDHTLVRRALAETIVLHDLPFRFSEYSKFREYSRLLNPNVRFYSRQTMVREIDRLYASEKAKLKDVLANIPSRICLTSDVWTAVTNEGYICLTAHFVDNEWKLRSKILNFCSFVPPHTGQHLANTVLKFLKDWGIEKKVFSITLDNASANNAMVANIRDYLNINNVLLSNGDYFHVRCCAHILNLIVQSGLAAAGDALKEIRNSVTYVRGSEGRLRQFKECVSQIYGHDHRFSLCTDVCTRWNSTYLMLASALKYRQAFQLYSTMDVNFMSCPNGMQWSRAELICDFLEPFYDITTIMSGSSYPTSNIFFQLVVKIEMLLLKNLDAEDGVMIQMAISMKSKFDKYWKDYSDILAFGTILDPRCKLEEVENVLKQIDEMNNEMRARNIEFEMKKLFEEYSELIGTSSQSGLESTQQQNQASSKALGGRGKCSFAIFKGSSSRQRSSAKTELDTYLMEPIMVYDEFEDLDVLQYWKLHSVRFPILSRMAADLLSIPITTVASESAFSIGSRVLTRFRSSCLPDHVQALVCTRNWLLGYALPDDNDDADGVGSSSTSHVESNIIEDDEA